MRTTTFRDVLLEEIAEIKSGVGFPISMQGCESGDFPFAKVGDISNRARSGEQFISDAPNWVKNEDLSTLKFTPFPTGTIVFAKIGEAIRQNFRAVSTRPMLFDNNVMGVIPQEERVDTTYLYFYLRTLDFYHLAGKTTVPAIRKSTIEKLKIPLPPLEEQRRIAAILDKADGVRRKRKEAIRLTEELLKSTFLEMFGDPVTNPKGWEVSPFGSLGKLDRGKSKHRPRNDPSLLGGKYPLIQTGDVANSKGVIKKYTQTYSDKGLAQSRMWPAGTLCITIAANIAQTGILTFDSCFPDSIVGFKPNNRVTTEYIQAWLGFLQPLLEDLAPQSAQKNINLQMLRELDVPVPPIDLQSKFSEFVERIGNNSRNYEKSEAVMDNLFNSLLQKAFRGEL
jgi:type I restriction enzyme S subunit